MRFLTFESATVSGMLGLLAFMGWAFLTAPEVSDHDREIIAELSDLAEGMEGVCYTSLSLANQGMWENDCGRFMGDEYWNDPVAQAAVGQCYAEYERLKANPYWHLEDLLCQRDALRNQLEMSPADQAKAWRRWWERDARLIDGDWLCKNLFDGEPMELSCADRDVVE